MANADLRWNAYELKPSALDHMKLAIRNIKQTFLIIKFPFWWRVKLPSISQMGETKCDRDALIEMQNASIEPTTS